RKPLVVFTPKSLLRHKLAVSSLDELAQGSFATVIDELDNLDKKSVTRLVMCSGKVYYELLEKRREQNLDHVAIIRIEQLYPYDEEAINAVLSSYPNVKDIRWCQEEPKNQGAWYNCQHRFYQSSHTTHPKATLAFSGRKPSASPAAGYMALHVREQQELLNDALGLAQSDNT
ncbi:MAG: 2-oxoglutarate dehydrogenase E1 component, partial [Halieaceae bacterium]|nr:2-oxoglutarate dehydrogenase E1 component [Halieaceae bacterium]